MESYFGHGPTPDHQHSSVEDLYRKVYFGAYDNAIKAITDRFNQPDFQKYITLQELIFNAIKGKNYRQELSLIKNLYGDDFNYDILEAQLDLLHEIVQISINNTKRLIESFRALPKSKGLLINEVIKVIKLIIVLPAINAISERSFSALKLVKTYLRSTTSANRFNHLMMFFVHKEKTDLLDINEICRVCFQKRHSA